MPINVVALVVFVFFFALVTFMGFAAVHWRRGDLDLLHEWGLAGGRFGTLVTWFLLGGDLYTAYTFVAVPALAFGAGALAFFAVPYTIIVYPFVFVVFPRLWSVARKHHYITAADFVQGRYGSRSLALAVALTGIVATMPYIALQLVGIQVVIAAMGVQSSGWLGELPLVIAFVILAAFTYTSGLRAPAAIAIVKDLMIYLTIAVCIIVVPLKLGGYGAIFAVVPAQKLILAAPGPGTLGAYSSYATLALGSALALFLYPHSVTGVLSSSSRHVIRRNAALLPAYSFLLASSRFWASWRSPPASTRRRNTRPSSSNTAPISPCRRCSWQYFRRGSRASASPPSPSARWCRRRSCRSPPPISGRAMSTGPSSAPTARRSAKRRWRNGCRSSSSSAPCSSSCCCRRNTRSNYNCLAACGSSRLCPP